MCLLIVDVVSSVSWCVRYCHIFPLLRSLRKPKYVTNKGDFEKTYYIALICILWRSVSNFKKPYLMRKFTVGLCHPCISHWKLLVWDPKTPIMVEYFPLSKVFKYCAQCKVFWSQIQLCYLHETWASQNHSRKKICNIISNLIHILFTVLRAKNHVQIRVMLRAGFWKKLLWVEQYQTREKADQMDHLVNHLQPCHWQCSTTEMTRTKAKVKVAQCNSRFRANC
jgi:hypothetical protein